MRSASKYIRDGGAIDYGLLDHQSRIKSILTTLYKDTAESFSEYMLGKKKSRTLKDMSVPTTPVVDYIMGQWVLQYGAIRITQIAETTRNDVRLILIEGIKEGLSEREIAKQINIVAKAKSASRAQTIARTETHSAANATAYETAKGVGLEMKKVWVAAQNSRTRDSHKKAHSDYREGIGLDDFFIIGGERMRYPADPIGSAAQVINCRCALVYELA